MIIVPILLSMYRLPNPNLSKFSFNGSVSTISNWSCQKSFVSYRSKAAIAKMPEKNIVALLGSKNFINGSTTSSCCAFTIDQSWFNEAESSRLRDKLLSRVISAAIPADSIAFIITFSFSPVGNYVGIVLWKINGSFIVFSPYKRLLSVKGES